MLTLLWVPCVPLFEILGGHYKKNNNVQDDLSHLPSKSGDLSKWTNYFHGWQSRFVVLAEGTLSYFKTREEDHFARAKIDITTATVEAHASDPLRFDVTVGDQSFFLRGQSVAEKESWMDAVKDSQKDAEGAPLVRNASVQSLVSLASNASSASSSSVAKSKEKLSEVQTFHEMAATHLDTLLSLVGVDGLGSGAASGMRKGHKRSNSDAAIASDKAVLRRELLSFKSTATSALSAMEDYSEFMQAREDKWTARVKRYRNKVKSLEVQYAAALQRAKVAEGPNNPDMQEGPNSLLTEEQWFDAIDEAGLLESPAAQRVDEPNSSDDDEDDNDGGGAAADAVVEHKWSGKVRKMIDFFVHVVATKDMSKWSVNSDNGAGLVCFNAVSEVGGEMVEKIAVEYELSHFNAEELCRYFCDPRHRTVWEPQDASKLIEKIDSGTQITWALCKRVWPSAQRDMLNIVHVEALKDDTGAARDRWICVSTSVEDPRIPANENGIVRVDAQAYLIAETVYTPDFDPANPQRKHVKCKFNYCADINPGGWAPKSIVSIVAKVELPKAMVALGKAAKAHFKHLPYALGKSSLA